MYKFCPIFFWKISETIFTSFFSFILIAGLQTHSLNAFQRCLDSFHIGALVITKLLGCNVQVISCIISWTASMYKIIVNSMVCRMAKGLESSSRPSLSQDRINNELEKRMSQMETAIQLVQGWTETEFRLFVIYFYFGKISVMCILETVVAKKDGEDGC